MSRWCESPVSNKTRLADDKVEAGLVRILSGLLC